MKRPNILLLVLDTQRADRLSCYGYPLETSPHLDKFAAEATLFTHAIAPAQWTIPSHASIFTGLYPSQHTLLQMDSVLPVGLSTLAERLQQAGYFTAGFSNNVMIGIINNGLERGFNRFINYAGAQYRQSDKKDRMSFGSFFNKLLIQVERSAIAKRIAMSPLVLPLSNAIFWRGANVKGNTVQSLTDAVQLMVERSGMTSNQPLFVFINLMGTHKPYQPPSWALERFISQSYRQPNTFLKQFNSYIKSLSDILREPLPPERKAVLDSVYNAEVAAQDVAIGKFFACLQQAGVLENTFVIIVADHGEHLGEKRLVGHEYGAYQELAHVPLLIKDPIGCFPPGTTREAYVSIRRLFHTVLTVADIAAPEEEQLSLTQPDGKLDQMPAFTEAWPPKKRLAENEQKYLETQGYSQEHIAIYDNGYKLIARDKMRLGLYATDKDPTEEQDLQHIFPEITQTLHKKIQLFKQQPNFFAKQTKQQLDDPILVGRLRELGYIE